MNGIMANTKFEFRTNPINATSKPIKNKSLSVGLVRYLVKRYKHAVIDVKL